MEKETGEFVHNSVFTIKDMGQNRNIKNAIEFKEKNHTYVLWKGLKEI